MLCGYFNKVEYCRKSCFVSSVSRQRNTTARQWKAEKISLSANLYFHPSLTAVSQPTAGPTTKGSQQLQAQTPAFRRLRSTFSPHHNHHHHLQAQTKISYKHPGPALEPTQSSYSKVQKLKNIQCHTLPLADLSQPHSYGEPALSLPPNTTPILNTSRNQKLRELLSMQGQLLAPCSNSTATPCFCLFRCSFEVQNVPKGPADELCWNDFSAYGCSSFPLWLERSDLLKTPAMHLEKCSQ